MTATATYPAAMAGELKSESGQSSGWPGYGTPVTVSTRFGGGAVDTGAASARPRSSHQQQQQQGGVGAEVGADQAGGGSYQHHQHHQRHHQHDTQQRDLRQQDPRQDPHLHQQHHHGRYSHEESDAYERAAPTPQLPPPPLPHLPTLTSHSSFPSLKRTFSETEQQAAAAAAAAAVVSSTSSTSSSSFQDAIGMTPDLRDEAGAKLTVSQDHKLLAFRKAQDRHTVVDQRGRMHQFELSAQLHGMFFLSELPSASSDGTAQPELTCYRRNLFQISGSLITPRGQVSVLVADTAEPVPVVGTEVTITAIESVDGNPVRLIVIPWKTPPPNSPEVATGLDAEPPVLPLIPCRQEDGSGGGSIGVGAGAAVGGGGSDTSDGDYAVYPIGWRRLQFRVATANNGRRKELQQHFVLHLKVVATLANGNKAVLAESVTAPIVVRGRSPRNFQARKEIPLLGSSAGSRGQALVETGLGIVAGPLTVKTAEAAAKLRAGGGVVAVAEMPAPRTAFTFSPPKVSGAQMLPPAMGGSSAYPSWSPQGGVPMSAHYPPTLAAAAAAFAAESQEMPLQATGAAAMPSMPQMSQMPQMPLPMAVPDPQPPIRTQYAYAPDASAAPAQHQLPASAPPIPVTDPAMSIPRYVDAATGQRPTKSPRGLNHDSVMAAHSAVAVSHESPSEYRYGSYGGAGGGSPGEIAATQQQQQQRQQQQHLHHHQQSPQQHSPHHHHHHQAYSPDPTSSQAGSTPREYYPSHSSTWATTAASTPNAAAIVAAVGSADAGAYHSTHETRSYTFPSPGYKSGAASSSSPISTGPPKSNHHHQPGHGHGHATYDGLSNYSWNAN